MSQDTFVFSGEQAPSGGGPAPGRPPVDRFEIKRQWTERAEEEQAEQAAFLYEKAVMRRIQADPAGLPVLSGTEEELEARSQELKLRQMCQGIAALVMVDEMEDSSDEDEDE